MEKIYWLRDHNKMWSALMISHSVCAVYRRRTSLVYLSPQRRLIASLLVLFFLTSCTTTQMQNTKTIVTEQIDKEFSQVAEIKDIQAEDTQKNKNQTPSFSKSRPTISAVKKSVARVPPSRGAFMPKREPSLEDTVGFEGRRPLVDPFRVGEKVELDVKYLNIEAGTVVMEILPFKTVNDRKAYHFKMNIQTKSTMRFFYTVDNTSETFLDFETLLPMTFTYSAKESSRIREYKTFFDWSKNLATQWRHEVHKKKGEKSRKISWELEPYTQNFLSSIYYLRVFQLEPGRNYSFRVAEEGKNYVFTFNVLRKEKLATALGEINTLVVQPEYEVDNIFSPRGQNTIWVTDDDRKFVVQLSGKMKIGSFMARVRSIERAD